MTTKTRLIIALLAIVAGFLAICGATYIVHNYVEEDMVMLAIAIYLFIDGISVFIGGVVSWVAQMQEYASEHNKTKYSDMDE